jgi:hypothetical protein
MGLLSVELTLEEALAALDALSERSREPDIMSVGVKLIVVLAEERSTVREEREAEVVQSALQAADPAEAEEGGWPALITEQLAAEVGRVQEERKSDGD